MAGQGVAYHGNILHNITHFMNMDFIGFGDNRLTGEVLEYGSLEDSLYVRLVLDGKRIVGIVKNYMLRLFAGEEFVLPDYQRAMLQKAGLSEAFIDEIEEKLHG